MFFGWLPIEVVEINNWGARLSQNTFGWRWLLVEAFWTPPLGGGGSIFKKKPIGHSVQMLNFILSVIKKVIIEHRILCSLIGSQIFLNSKTFHMIILVRRKLLYRKKSIILFLYLKGSSFFFIIFCHLLKI